MMRCALVILGLVIVGPAPPPQTPARDAAQTFAAPSGTGRISGVVRDHRGERVRRATVLISGDMRLDRMTVADDEGGFAFAGLPAGRFTVTAEKAGHPRMSYGASRPFRAGAGVFLRDGQHAERIDLTLAPGGAIEGTVFDERGEPLPGVPIMAWEIRTALGGERTLDFPATGGESVTTDDRGMYRVHGLPPGDYTVGTAWFYHGQASNVRVPTDAEIRAAFQTGRPAAPSMPAAPPAAGVEPPQYNYAPTFTPGVVDPLSAAVLAIAAGEEQTGVDLRMQFLPTSRLAAAIVGPDGAPAGARVTLTRRSQVRSLNTSQVAPGSNGSFTAASLSPGLYALLAEAAARDGQPPLWAMMDIVVSGGEPIAVTLTLQPALVVTGRVVFEGTTLQPPADLSRVSVRLAGAGPIRPGTVAIVDAAGAVSISGVIPGPYTAGGSVPAGAAPAAPGGAAWSVRSVVLDGRDVTDRTFDLSAGGASGLTLTFTDRVSELSGTLTGPSGAPATDYFIIAIPADRAYWIPQSRRIVSTRPDGSGRYVFRGLPAGDYRLAVTTDLVPRDLQTVSALERLAEQSVAVTIGTGERRTFDLRTAGGGERRP
jgi:hypothetical protein